MAGAPGQGDPQIGFAPDPVLGFAYDRESPPDVPPGMTLAQWRRARHRGHGGPRTRRHCHLHRPRVRLHRPRRPACDSPAGSAPGRI